MLRVEMRPGRLSLVEPPLCAGFAACVGKLFKIPLSRGKKPRHSHRMMTSAFLSCMGGHAGPDLGGGWAEVEGKFDVVPSRANADVDSGDLDTPTVASNTAFMITPTSKEAILLVRQRVAADQVARVDPRGQHGEGDSDGERSG